MIKVYNSQTHEWQEAKPRKRMQGWWEYPIVYINTNNLWKPAYTFRNYGFVGVRYFKYSDGTQGTSRVGRSVPTIGTSGGNIPRPYAPYMSQTPFSPFDFIAPWCDIRNVGNVSGLGEAISIPKFYYKWTKTTSGGGLTEITLEISDNADYALQNGYHVSPAHAVRQTNGSEADEVYVARYLSAGSNGESVTNENIYAYRLSDQFYKTGKVWAYDFAMHYTIAMLVFVEYASWNPYLIIGNGDGLIAKTGLTDTMPYHTGVIEGHMQYRGIEDLWHDGGTFTNGGYRRVSSSSKPLYGSNNPNRYYDILNDDFSHLTSIFSTITGVDASDTKEVGNMAFSSASGFNYFPRANSVVNAGANTSMGIPYAVVDNNDYESEWFLMGYADRYINHSTWGMLGISTDMASGVGAHRRLQYLPHVDRA